MRSWQNAGLGRESLLSSEAEELPRKTKLRRHSMQT